jgi:hypothetical protein
MSMKNSNDTTWNRTRDLPTLVQCLNQLHQRVAAIYLVTHLFKSDVSKKQKPLKTPHTICTTTGIQA